MIDGNCCETLCSPNSQFVTNGMWLGELEESIREYYRAVIAPNTKSSSKVYSEQEQVDYVLTMLQNQVINPTANVGMISIGQRYRMFDTPPNLGRYQIGGFLSGKFQPLLYHSARWLNCRGMSEKHLMKHSIEYNTMLLHHLSMSAYVFDEYKRSFGLMFSLGGSWRSSHYKLQDLRFWWLLVNNVEVSVAFLKDYANLFGFTEQQLQTKLRAFFKKRNVHTKSLLQHIPNEQPRILQRLSELRLI